MATHAVPPGPRPPGALPPGPALPGTVTTLLREAGAGDAQALDRVFAAVYAELRRLARLVRRGQPGATLSSTALVHEAYLKLVPAADQEWRGRAHFFALAARAMRQVLVDAARARLRAKRGGGAQLVTLDGAAAAAPLRPEHLIALDAALERLAALEPRHARVVECRYFAGLTAEETAALLDVSVPTVNRDWRAARAWLAAELGDA
ncbi:DNA-directed RNA polymerase sigma-70 factor [Gemmatimonadetes bacterium T265]|nr:DNA-directed RNA polymerase sigma-70 factor [Gemmatimonadetes bacterium T265]